MCAFSSPQEEVEEFLKAVCAAIPIFQEEVSLTWSHDFTTEVM